MTNKFKNIIKKYIANGDILFYNSSGNKDAYKLFVRHISYAPYINKGIKVGDYIHPTEIIKIVDFKKEEIFETEDKIKIIPLKNIE